MSTYQKKYYYQFTSLDGKVNVVELWWLTATTPTAEEVKGGAMPFSTEMPDLDHKFQVVRGTGCEINLLSPTDRKFFDGLYHTNMKEYMIKHYIDSSINWLGYLNSELVRESYSEAFNYPFQITGNDGFALLDRLQFLQTDGTKYTGVMSQFALIQIALTRVGLPYTNLYISLSTTFADFSGDADSTILHESYVDCANFYNEDGEAETMRKVIEGCLATYGALITQRSGDIRITDVNLLGIADPIMWQKFTQSTGVYVEDVLLDPVVDISDVGYMGTGSEIEMSGGKNKQVISYSPYPLKSVLPEGLRDLNEFSGSIPANFSVRDDNRFNYKTLTGHNALNIYSPATFEQSFSGWHGDAVDGSDASICIQWHAGTIGTKIIELKDNPFVSFPKGNDVLIPGSTKLGFKGVSMKISGEAYFDRYWGPSDSQWGMVRSYDIKLITRIGDKSADIFGNKTVWNTYPATPQICSIIRIEKPDNSNVAGAWIPFSVNGNEDCYYTTHEDLSGLLYLDFYSDLNFIDTNGREWPSVSPSRDFHPQVRIRNLAISFIDSETKKDISDTDVEYIGYLDTTVKEEAEKIELICGTDVNHADRGKIMMYSGGLYSSIKEWTRSGQTFKLEELLLNSLSSNYTMGYLTLSNLKLQNGFNQLSVITDSGIISAKNFMVKSAKVNYRDNLIETTLTEVSPDTLTIVPYV